MTLPKNTILDRKSAKIVFAIMPRLTALLFLLLQNSLWQNNVFFDRFGLLFFILAADAMLCTAYSVMVVRGGGTGMRRRTAAAQEGGNGIRRRKILDAVFFFASLLAFYFIDFLCSDGHLFPWHSNPYDNIILILTVQLVCLGFFFLGTAVRTMPGRFVKRPYIPLALAAVFFGLSMLGGRVVLAPLLMYAQAISLHLAILGAVFYCLGFFYLLSTGMILCYEKYIRPRRPVTIAVTALAVISLPLLIFLLGGPENMRDLFRMVGGLIPGLFRQDLQHNLFWGGIFLLLAGMVLAMEIKKPALQKALFVVLTLALPLPLYAGLVLLPFFSLIFIFSLFQPVTAVLFLFFLFLLFYLRALFHGGRLLLETFEARAHKVHELGGGALTRTPSTRWNIPRLKIAALSCLLMAVLPALVVLNAFFDKAELRKAYYSMYDTRWLIMVDRSRLRSILHEFGPNNRDTYLPLVTPLRTAVILENKKLSETVSREISRFYFGPAAETSIERGRPRLPRKVRLEAMRETALAGYGTYSQSKVLLQVENPTGKTDEFFGRFSLPPDVFVTGLSLWIEGNERRGLLAAKDQALTFYEQTVRRLRDPALLRYENDGSCTLRIFPVAPGRGRRAAIILLYRRPFTLTIGGHSLALGKNGAVVPTMPDPTGEHPPGAPGDLKAPATPDVPGGPSNNVTVKTVPDVLHFVIDCSASAEVSPATIKKLISACLQKLNWHGPVRYTAANYNWETKDTLDNLFSGGIPPRRGSLVYSRVLPGLLREYKKSGEHPRFVFISDTKDQWLFNTSLPAIGTRFPRTGTVYRLDTKGSLFAFPAFRVYNETEIADIYASSPTPVLSEKAGNTDPPVHGSRSAETAAGNLPADTPAAVSGMDRWKQCFRLFTAWVHETLKRPFADTDLRRLNTAAAQQGLLLPSLSYIVLENTAQENSLKQLAEKNDNGGLLLPVETQPVGMDEELNSFILFLLLLSLPLCIGLFLKSAKN